jgi:pyruvate,water dikinase
MPEKFRTYAEYLVDKMSKEFKEEEKEKPSGKKKDGGKIPKEDRLIRWLPELGKKDIPVAGGKGANLAEMYNIGLPVPAAFVITAQAFDYFLDANKLKEKIRAIMNIIDIDNTKQLEEKAKEIQQLIINTELPEDLKEAIIDAYNNLNVDSETLKTASADALSILKSAKEPCFVAVRSSATTEDLKTASFAGQQETFLNVKGNEELIEAVRKCFASLFTARAVYYRSKKGFAHEKVLIAVIVEKMINSDKSGVIFTVNPATNKNEIVIESVWGLGEGIVSGAIMPDECIINKSTLKIEKKHIGQKDIFFTRNAAGKTIKQELHPSKKNSQVLSDFEIKQLANYSIDIEQHYKLPQDIEFAVEAGHIYIVQTRPVTTLGKEVKRIEVKANAILEGIAASPGIASGIVKIVRSIEDLEKIKQNDILVTKMTNPDMVVAMQRASGIVTSEGGATAHAAIVSREMGIPCVTGTRKALEVLSEGQLITVDGTNGRVYEGKISAEEQQVKVLPITKTKTKIKVIIDLPDFAKRAAESNAEGIGLLRLEGIIASAKKHPLQYLRENKLNEYQQLLFDGIKRIVQHFPSKEAWVRTSDIRSDEFQHLQGSPQVEANPMLGMHGIRMSLANAELFKAELKAIKQVAEQGFKIGIMLPQVISSDEVEKTKKLMDEVEMPANVKFGVMVETPAAVEIIESLCKQGIDFISFGTNDLTQYTLAVDRGNEKVQFLYDEMHAAILSQLAKVIEICKEYKVETSICGQAGSRKEMVEWLVKHGIDSISVNADAAYEISKFVAELELQQQGQEREEGKVSETAKRVSDEEEKIEEDLEKEDTEIEPLVALKEAEEAADEQVMEEIPREDVEKLDEEFEESGIKDVVEAESEGSEDAEESEGKEGLNIF